MAQTFKNAKASIGQGNTAIYTVPANTTAIVIGCQIANVGQESYDLNLFWSDSSDANANTYLAEGVSIPDASAYEPIGGKLILEAGDILYGQCNTPNMLDVTVSVLELS